MVATPSAQGMELQRMARVLGIDHVQLAMPPGGEDRARRFYGAGLGLREVDKPKHLRKRGGCWFEGEGLKVHLGIEDDFRPARKAHPALLVDDLAELLGKLAKQGYTASVDEPLDGYERRYVSDPFGNRLELMQRIEDRNRSD